MTKEIYCDQCVTNSDGRRMCVSLVPIFNHLTIDEMKEIVKVVTPMSYERGEIIFRANEKADHCKSSHCNC